MNSENNSKELIILATLPMTGPCTVNSDFISKSLKSGADGVVLDCITSSDSKVFTINRAIKGLFHGSQKTFADVDSKTLINLCMNFKADSAKTEPVELAATLNSDSNCLFSINLTHCRENDIPLICEIINQSKVSDKIFIQTSSSKAKETITKYCPSIKNAFTPVEIVGIYALFRSGLLYFKKQFKSDLLITPENIGPSIIGNQGLIRILKKKGIMTHISGVDNVEQFARLLAAGAHGFYTAYPATLRTWYEKNCDTAG